MTAIVIVGAGECGTRAALALRAAGHRGDLTLIGEEPHPPYERPPLSKDALAAGALAPKPVAGSEGLASARIDLRPGVRVRGIDRDARRLDTTAGPVRYDRLLLATGARARALTLEGAGAGAPPVLTLRTLDDATRIRAALGPGCRLAVIGGGFIGLELAATARRLGAAVTVIEAQPRLLARGVPAALAGILADRHRAEGVDLRLGAAVAGLAPGGVVLGDGGRVAADLIVAGIGALPETALAAAAGLALDNGIAVDATLVTPDPAIFAAGDCASVPHPLYDGRRIRLESWRSAQEQGALAARNLMGAGQPVGTVPWVWSDQYDLTLQIAGLADGATAEIRRDLPGGAVILFHLAPDGRLLAASGLGPGNAVARDIRLAERLIERRRAPDPRALADPGTGLKALLQA